MAYHPIEDYGIIGNMRTTALVEPAVHEKIGEFLKSRTVPISSITVDAMTVLRHEEKGWTSFRELPFGA